MSLKHDLGSIQAILIVIVVLLWLIMMQGCTSNTDSNLRDIYWAIKNG